MKAILVIEIDDEYLDRINATSDELFADVTIYKKERTYISKCWYPLKPLPKSINEEKALDITKVNKRTYLNGVVDGYKICLKDILEGEE